MLTALAVAIAAGPDLLRSDLTLDDLFPRRSYYGKTARGMKWSSDGRYLAYLWNPYRDRGADLWLYDARGGKPQRFTSIEMMAGYDLVARKAIDHIKKDEEELDKADKMDDVAYREWLQKRREEEEKRREPLPGYPGIGEVAWANAKPEMLFTYRGDIFRWKVGDKAPIRLTRTRDDEVQVQYTKDDQGFFFRRSDGVYRMRFDSAETVQLNPELPNRMPLQGYRISPDESQLMLLTGRNTAPYRQVDYITYRGRFAEARKTGQFWGFPDETVKEERYLYLYDLNDDPKLNPKHDGKPWEIWKWSGGEDVWEVAVNDEPWSPDSKLFAFSSSKRNDRTIEVRIANLEKRSIQTVYSTKFDGEPSSAGFVDPFFLPDGSLVALLESSGFRHAWRIDPLTQGATQITRGDFEAYPLRATADGKQLLVRAQREHLARMDLYRVDLATGEYRRLTTREGVYDSPALSKDLSRAALNFISWEQRRELAVLDAQKGGGEKTLTDSHRPGFEKAVKLKPRLFEYKNRHGQTIQGFMFLPPDYKKGEKRPLFIYVYGGPLASPMAKTVNLGNFGSSEFMFNQYLAYALGYVTVAIDPRGQTGYGAAFGKANFEQPGKPQVEDLADGAKWLIENYGCDPAKVGVYGWSFGGFQTQMCLYTAPETFTLGIAGAGPTEWQNYNSGYTENVIGRVPEGKVEDLDKFSLTKFAKNLRSPLLLLHGVEDTNVLYQHTMNVYRVLLQYGKGPLVELSIDPTGGHGMGGDMNTKDRHAIYLAFVMRHWGPWKAQ